MFRKNTCVTAIVLMVVFTMVSGICFIPVPAAAVSRNLLANTEFRDGGAGWSLSEYGAVDGKVTREGYPSIRLTVAKAKAPVDAMISQVLPAESWAVGDTLTFSAYLARGKNPAFTKKTLPTLALYAVVNGERTLFPSSEIKKLGDIKEAGTKNKSSAWSRFSVTMTVPQAAAEVGCLLTFPQNGVMHMAQPKLERGSIASDWFPDAGHKEIAGDGTVLVGTTGGEGFSLSLPAGAYPGVNEIAVKVESAGDVPAMPHAVPVGDALAVETGGPVRLEEAATLIYAYDPAKTPNPLLLCLGYFDGEKWIYNPAESKDAQNATVTFRLFHFSVYYPSQFPSVLDAAKHFAGEFAARKVLGEGGGDARTASRATAEVIAGKLGLGESEFATRMIADIAADQDVLKVVDECQQDGWSNTGYEKVMDFMCGKIADHLVENRAGITAEEGAVLTYGEKGLKQIGTLIKVADSGSKILANLMEGDSKAVAGELFNVATDNTGAAGKALKYTLQGMQNALDVWRDGEVENAFEVYTKGSPGSLFGYGLIEPLDFESVWDGMKGASRQLCIERIAAENDARRLIGMPALSAREEDFYREKVKAELKSEFERRVKLQGRIDAEKKNLEMIFAELEESKALDSTNVWIRGLGGMDDTLEERLGRMEHLIQRIYRDLDVNEVYSGPQLTDELNGRISAAAMAEMVRGYFAADTQAEGDKFLRGYYKRFGVNLIPTAEELEGTYSWTVAQIATSNCKITVSGETAQIDFGDQVWTGTYADGILTGYVEVEPRVEGHTIHFGAKGDFTFQFTRQNNTITGSGTWSGILLPEDVFSGQLTYPYNFAKTD